MARASVDSALEQIGTIIERLADPDIFPWLGARREPTEAETNRAATIVADRLCGVQSDPIVRNAQERRQLALLKTWLEARGYAMQPAGRGVNFKALVPGTLAFHMNAPVSQEGTESPSGKEAKAACSLGAWPGRTRIRPT